MNFDLPAKFEYRMKPLNQLICIGASVLFLKGSLWLAMNSENMTGSESTFVESVNIFSLNGIEIIGYCLSILSAGMGVFVLIGFLKNLANSIPFIVVEHDYIVRPATLFQPERKIYYERITDIKIEIYKNHTLLHFKTKDFETFIISSLIDAKQYNLFLHLILDRLLDKNPKVAAGIKRSIVLAKIPE